MGQRRGMCEHKAGAQESEKDKGTQNLAQSPQWSPGEGGEGLAPET